MRRTEQVATPLAVGPRRIVVVVLGPGVSTADERPASESALRVLRTDAGQLTETSTPGGEGSATVVVARVWRAGRGAAPAILFAEADACVFVPDPHDALGVRNRRAFRAAVEALAAAGRDPTETCLFVADDRATVRRGYAADPRRPVRTMLRATDFVAAARAAAALLDPTATGEKGTGAGRAFDAGTAFLLILTAVLAAALAAAAV